MIDLIEKALNSPEPIVLFRLPGETTLNIADDNCRVLFCDFENGPADALPIDRRYLVPSKGIPAITPESVYKGIVDCVINRLTPYPTHKTVISRVITGKADLQASRISRFFDSNPDALCVLARDSRGDTFIMATPELLLDYDGHNYRTMALAGTRAADVSGVWDEKNLQEQAIVEQYIFSALYSELNARDVTARRNILTSNNVAHICTDIAFQLDSSVTPEDVLTVLPPTPAVCGTPLKQALDMIHFYEWHQRGLYTGYTLLVRKDGTLSAYVNLRCALVDATGRFAIYTGSGITANSNPDDEYRETHHKAAPLLNMLQDV